MPTTVAHSTTALRNVQCSILHIQDISFFWNMHRKNETTWGWNFEKHFCMAEREYGHSLMKPICAFLFQPLFRVENFQWGPRSRSTFVQVPWIRHWKEKTLRKVSCNAFLDFRRWLSNEVVVINTGVGLNVGNVLMKDEIPGYLVHMSTYHDIWYSTCIESWMPRLNFKEYRYYVFHDRVLPESSLLIRSWFPVWHRHKKRVEQISVRGHGNKNLNGIRESLSISTMCHLIIIWYAKSVRGVRIIISGTKDIITDVCCIYQLKDTDIK